MWMLPNLTRVNKGKGRLELGHGEIEKDKGAERTRKVLQLLSLASAFSNARRSLSAACIFCSRNMSLVGLALRRITTICRQRHRICLQNVRLGGTFKQRELDGSDIVPSYNKMKMLRLMYWRGRDIRAVDFEQIKRSQHLEWYVLQLFYTSLPIVNIRLPRFS